ncbi:helix-turn-helix transcriptional regulator [Gracilibacillus salinarum]|uniref:AraC family transcriptional regulator n=1 Tax=Gracilibacillus salinarum TaxID=2932255 RepID=A0ABY4GV50_9BACI|nr:AraC family transcriptional regulator [Gracilibacillus salinarum]UOQ87512.1 AraC family transcriptional regulator [Gracilibacillus salinarum]
MMQRYFSKAAGLLINKNYRKNLIIFLLVTSLPGIILSIILFVVSKSQMEDELHEVHENYLGKTVETIDEQLTNVELLLGSWVSDTNFIQTFHEIDVIHEYQRVRQMYKMLVIMEGSNPLIGRVELFIDKNNPIVFTKNGYKKLEEKDEKETYRNIFEDSSSNIFWTSKLNTIQSNYSEDYAPIKLVHKIPVFNSSDTAYAIVFLDIDIFSELIKSPYEDGSVFLQRTDAEWAFTEDKRTTLNNIENGVLDKVNQSSLPNDTFDMDWGEHTYTVTYDTIPRLQEDWKYISIAPLSAVTQPVLIISKIFLIVSICMLGLAIILAVFVSNKLYAPIRNLMGKVKAGKSGTANEFEMIENEWNSLSAESEQLHRRITKQFPYLRQGFLIQLIQGFFNGYQERILIERMEHFGWQLKDQYFSLMYIQLFGFSNIKDKFDEDEGLITFIASNIMEELIKEYQIQADVINFHNLTLGVFIISEENKSYRHLKEELGMINNTLIKYMNEKFNMDVSIGISRKTEHIKQIYQNFEETKSALSFRNVHENNQIIEIDNVNELNRESQSMEYPFDIEKQILHAIRLRDKEEAKTLITEFFYKLSSVDMSEAVYKQCAFQLLGSILQIAIQSGLMHEVVNESSNLYQKLNEIKDMNEMDQWFKVHLIDPMISELSSKKNQRLQIIVEKVMHYIEGNYMKDVSLEECAEFVKLNPSILSKLFKDITGWNFIDYITNIRLNKGKELLIETDMKINEIAENIGYKHSYFNRLFKRNEGITPSEYRKQSRKDVLN